MSDPNYITREGAQKLQDELGESFKPKTQNKKYTDIGEVILTYNLLQHTA